jgi:phage recombination protein Bet
MAELTNVQQLEVNRRVESAKQELEKAYLGYDKLSVMTGFKSEMISIMHRTIAKNTSVTELAYFLQVCKSSGLNPLNKEIWCYKDNKENVIIFTGRDGFLKKMKEDPNYVGMRSSDVCEFDEFEIDMIEGIVKHKITTNRGKEILGAYAIVSIRGKQDTIVWLDFKEYDLGQAKWKSAPKMMIKKCAQAQALKEACGLTGIQVEEAFVVNDGIATAIKDDLKTEVEKQVDFEEDRLIKLIEACKTPEALQKFFDDCTTPKTIDAYDKKRQSFQVS